MQRTIPNMGLDPIVPIRSHPNDNIITEDGKACLVKDAFDDCRDKFWSSAELCHDSNVEIVTEILDKEDEWITEYCTTNNDYADSYSVILDEDSSNHLEAVKEWIFDNYDKDLEELASIVLEDIDGSFHCCELEYSSSDYACYNGKGCCLDSFQVGEYENQIDFDRCAELSILHNKGILDDILDDYYGNACVYRTQKMVKNEKTGYYETVGRETYGSDNEMTTFHSPGGIWHFYVDPEVMRELVTRAILQTARSCDEISD